MNFSKRQIEIILAATHLIGEKGVQNLTTKNLAKEIGFSEPALYRHFKDKTEIISSVLVYYKYELQLGLKSVISNDLSALEKIEALVEFQFTHFTKYPAIIMVIFSETSFQYTSVLSNVVKSIMEEKSQGLVNLIESGEKDNSIRNDISAQQLCVLIMGSMRLTVLRWRLSNFSFNLVKEGNTLQQTLKLLLIKG